MNGYNEEQALRDMNNFEQTLAENLSEIQSFLGHIQGRVGDGAFDRIWFVTKEAIEQSYALQWISVNDRLPEKCGWVLCITSKGHAFAGKYTKGHEIEYWDDNYDGEYDEVEDKNGTLYLKPGWYECEEQVKSDYDGYWISRTVTHWMPLPEPPQL